MSELLVGLLTAVPVLLGAWLGARRGGIRSLAWLSKWIVAWGTGIGLAAYGLRRGWDAPWGLITPVIVGLLAAVVLRVLMAWRKKRNLARKPLGLLQRSSGAALGAALGFVLAVVGWQIALLASSLAAPLPEISFADSAQRQPAEEVAVRPQKSAWASLAELAHRSFIRHLPVAGPLTEEILAVATILKTPQPMRKEFARHKEWDRLADLPSFQDIASDPTLFADIDAAVAGNLIALYRLQTHPRIIKFYQEERLQAIIANLQASKIATELIEFQDAHPGETAIEPEI